MEPEFSDVLRRPNASTSGSTGTGWFGTWSPMKGVDAPSFAIAVLAGGCASSAVDVAIFPLDTIKTRLQSPLGFRAAGGYRNLYSGVTAAAAGAAPGGALFFGTYEFARSVLIQRQPASERHQVPHWMMDATAACIGATSSSVLRNPAVVVQQRMQVGQFSGLRAAIRGIALEGGPLAFYSGLSISIAREIPFAFIQFPIYEQLKRLVGAGGDVTPSQGALCGSVAGSVAAAVTTPLDVLKTRRMLGHSRHGLLREIEEIVRMHGVSALFSGFVPRVGWMALGGYIFFGVYEAVLRTLLLTVQSPSGADAQTSWKAFSLAAGLARPPSSQLPPASRQPPSHADTLQRLPLASADACAVLEPLAPATAKASAESPAAPPSLNVSPPLPPSQQSQQVSQLVALLSGGLAGMTIDGALYPVDTFKTRSIQGLPMFAMRGTLLERLRQVSTLWRGIGAAVLPAIPSAAAFFCTYEGVKNWLGSDSTSACCVAAATAEASSCMLRVPADLIKMKMQSGAGGGSSLWGAVRLTWAEGGICTFYRGLGATLCLDVPFALLQFPLYEALRHHISRLRTGSGAHGARADGVEASPRALDGALAGACAGALAAFLTTPLDVIRTRHVLWMVKPGERRSLPKTVLALARVEGFAGFWRGVLPRTVYMALGGTVYLGTYSYTTELLVRVLG